MTKKAKGGRASTLFRQEPFGEIIMGRIKKEFLQRMISHINRKAWWHVPPLDPEAYQKRGKFLASSFAEAEFYGRPLDKPERPHVAKPLVGSERAVCRILFGKFIHFPSDGERDVLEKRFALDARIKNAALVQGYDSIVIMHPRCYTEFKRTGKIPRMLELNILSLVSRKSAITAPSASSQ